MKPPLRLETELPHHAVISSQTQLFSVPLQKDLEHSPMSVTEKEETSRMLCEWIKGCSTQDTKPPQVFPHSQQGIREHLCQPWSQWPAPSQLHHQRDSYQEKHKREILPCLQELYYYFFFALIVFLFCLQSYLSEKCSIIVSSRRERGRIQK